MALKKIAFDATALMIARIFQAAVTAISLPILARFLQPSDFGLVAAANSIFFLASTLADAGFGNSLVRTPLDDRVVWSSVFWLTLFWSACLSILLCASAVPFGWLIMEPRVAPLIAAMAAIPFGQALLAAPLADLQKRHQFGLIGASDIFGSIVGIGAAISLSIANAGSWALVAQSFAFLIAKAAIVLGSTHFRPTLTFNRHLVGGHAHFARDTVAVSFVHFFNSQMDNIMIARSAGAGPLGMYSMAYRIMSLPSMISSANNALYPRFVRLYSRNEKKELRQLVLIVTTALAIAIFPPMALVSAASHSVFTVLLSSRWSEASSVYPYLAVVGALQAIGAIHSTLLMAIGRTDIRLRISIEFLIPWMIILVIAVRYGIEAVAAGYLFCYLAYYPRFLSLFLYPIGCSLVQYFRELALPAIVSAVFALTHIALRHHFSFSEVAEICVAASEIVIAYLLIGGLMRRRIVDAIIVSRAIFGKAERDMAEYRAEGVPFTR